MNGNSEEQREFAIWVNSELKIVTFCQTDGYRKLIFASHDEKFDQVYRFCQSGYRIL